MTLTQRLRGFSNKAKFALIVPAFILTLGCGIVKNEYRTIEIKERNEKIGEIKVNHDYSSVIMKVKDKEGVIRTDYLELKDGCKIERFEDFSAGKYNLVKYKINPKGLNNSEAPSIDSRHELDRETIERRESDALDQLDKYKGVLIEYVNR